MQELERGDSGLRSAASVQSGLVMYPIYAYGSEAQKEQWLPGLQSGEKVGCFGLTEPDHGSDPGGMKTRARKTGDGYVLNGTKLWITNGSIADVAVVWAKEDDGEICGYLVEKGTPGFSTLDIHGKFSMRASITSRARRSRTAAFRRPTSCPKVKGLRGPLGCLNQARYGIAWGARRRGDGVLRLGAAVLAAAHPVRQARSAAFQLVQQKLVDDDHRDHQGPAAGALQLGRLKDAGTLRPQQVSMAKMNNVQMRARHARAWRRDVLGAAGIVDEHPVIRHMLNLETVNTYEGTHDIHTPDHRPGHHGARRLRGLIVGSRERSLRSEATGRPVSAWLGCTPSGC